MSELNSNSEPQIAKGNLVGEVIWSIVTDAVRDAPMGERVVFMLTALPAIFLEGVTRTTPINHQIEGRSLKLVMNPEAATNLNIQPPAEQSGESAVHWRHSTAANVIVFAPSDAEREGIGAGLGPIARIDGRRIIHESQPWLKKLEEAGQAESYLASMLEGLRQSEIYIDLEMWVDFILALHNQDFALPADKRVQAAAPALRIPKDGLIKLPKYTPGATPAPKSKFQQAFRAARDGVGCYVSLLNPKQEPVNTQEVRNTIEELKEGEMYNGQEYDKVWAAAIELIEDESYIRPGEWRESQRRFCETVSWERIGSEIFAKNQRMKNPPLGQKTLDYIEGNFPTDVTEKDRELLTSLPNTIPKEPRDEERDFFDRWQERLNHPDAIRLFKNWQRRVVSKEVLGHDLISTLYQGFQALAIAGSDVLGKMTEPTVLIRATQHNKAMFWEKLDQHVHKLFRFELQSIKGLTSNRVKWDLDACFKFESREDSYNNDARKIDLELYLVEAGDQIDPTKYSPRVRATFQPGYKPADEPISLALPWDIEELSKAAEYDTGMFRNLKFTPRTGGKRSQISTTTLKQNTTFVDVLNNPNGRMFAQEGTPKQDVLKDIVGKVEHLLKLQSLPTDSAKLLREKIESFKNKYKEAIVLIAKNPSIGFESEVIDNQAKAYAELCNACRQHARSPLAREQLRPLVAQIGIVTSNESNRMCILAAWHPLRLAERKAKIRTLSHFIESVLLSEPVDLTIAFEQQRAIAHHWFFPEVAVVQDNTFIPVESVGGYSLMAPATAQSVEALEHSAPSAAKKFIDGLDQYLDVYPHQTSNLSAIIFDSESLSLPREIARLMAQRIHSDPDLRCDLIISHHDQNRMRHIYKSQNIRLGAENISDTAKGFLSRLRVDVKPSQIKSDDYKVIRDVDLAFLHDVVSRQGQPIWEHEPADKNDLNMDFDFDNALLPRRCQMEIGSSRVGIYLTMPRPPQPVAEYQNLLYEMIKEAILPEDHHGVLIRQVDYKASQLKDLIDQAHNTAEWVVSYDKLSCRALLEGCDVKIIQDISMPDSDDRVIISARDVNQKLQDKIQQNLVTTCDFTHQTADHYTKQILDDVIQISGRKLLAAAQAENASREMIGLSIMRTYMESMLPPNKGSIWISLDDYRSWFTTGKGRIADAVSITILDDHDDFVLLVQVGEAKFVQSTHASIEITEAQLQVRESVEQFSRNYIDNNTEISRKAWCNRLADILTSRDRLSKIISNPRKRGKFQEKLAAGSVQFHISGEAVICLHDDHTSAPKMEWDPERPHLRSHTLPTPMIRALIEKREEPLPNGTDLRNISWYPSKDLNTPNDVDKAITAVDQSKEICVISTAVMGTALPFKQDLSETEIDERSISEIPDSQMPTPCFIPKPVFQVLVNMAGREEGAITDSKSTEWAKNICQLTQRALSNFGMTAYFSSPSYHLTPNAVLITFKGHESLTVDKVRRRTSELLTTHGIDVIHVQPESGRISLIVRREQRAIVHLASTWLGANWPDREPGYLTNFILGAREDTEQILYLNIADKFANYQEHGPHTLIAGSTGSGKGILIQGLLLQMITFNNPANIKLIVIDPKMGVDFKWIQDAPHLDGPVISDPETAQETFEKLGHEMDARYKKMEEHKVQNITEYNEKVPASERLSRIFLVHDEMGAWMSTEQDYTKTVMSAVAHLGMKARAAGIHLILITQRADKDAIPPRLRDNLGNRLCLKVNSVGGSKIVLGKEGAERLLGKGHMMCQLDNQESPVGHDFFMTQVPFVESEDIQVLADVAISYWRNH